MIRTLSVFYLHKPSRQDARILQVMEYGMTDAFREFCRETFDASVPHDYPPLKLAAVPSAEALAKSLFTSGGPRGVLTEQGRACCLFLIDADFIDAFLEGMDLREWLKLFFPAIPKVVLVRRGQSRDIAMPSRRWTKKDVSVFRQPARHRERLVHLFKSFWMPRFSSALRQYVTVKAGTNWHTPGHNGGRAFSQSPFLRGLSDSFGDMIFRTDLSVSVESLGDLSSPEGRTPLSEAQKLTSEIFGTVQSCYVTNGTSTSNKAMLMTLLRPGETVLVDRNCHKSVHHAIVTSGAVPQYLPARWNRRLGVWGPVSMEDIRAAIASRPPEARPRMLVLTTCTYEGVLYPVWSIARLCEREGLLFYADEAWAAYLAFHPFYAAGRGTGDAVRYNAVSESSGAHFSVQSTHKTLAAFSQASMIHVSMRFKRLLEEDSSPAFRWLRRRFSLHGRGSYEKFSHDLHEFLRYWHSTSPHYPFLAALDVAGVQMRLEGMKIVDERIRWVSAFRKRVAEACGRPENECFAGLEDIAGPGVDWRAAGFMKDPLKVVLMLRSQHACDAFKKALLKAHIQWEKASSNTILFLVTAGTAEEHFEYLFRVCRQYRRLIGPPAPSKHRREAASAQTVAAAVSAQPEILPHYAALCDGELVSLEDAPGRIASQFIVPYPPGIPVLIPGLRITADMVKLIRDVIAADGPDAVHGLFRRGNHPPYMIEVLNRDEEARASSMDPAAPSARPASRHGSAPRT